MRTGTLSLPLTFNQIVYLVEQLPKREKIKLGQKIAEEMLDNTLSELLKTFKAETISEEIINEEVEIVRTQLYANRKKH